MPINRPSLRIDAQPSELSFAYAEAAPAETSYAPPAVGYIPPPTGVQLAAGINRSDRSAVAYISADWNDPASAVQEYEVQWATDSAFTQGLGTATAKISSATLNGLKDQQAYWVRVRAIYRDVRSDWSAAATITTPADDAPPSQVSGAAAALGIDGVLTLTGTTPSENNFAAIQVRIRGGVGDTIYTTQAVSLQPGRAFRWSWSAEENVKLSGGGDGTLVLEVASLNWSGFASDPVTLAVHKDPPATPAATVAWDPITGTATWTWASVAFESYTLAIDGVERPAESGYAYTVTQNKKEHSGSAAATLAWAIVARDPLQQASPAATGTATLAAPADVTGATATWDRANGLLLLDWGDVASVAGYVLDLDGKERPLQYSAYQYVAQLNAQEHAGTADNSITWKIWAVDGLGQRSAHAATGTATLPRPAAPTVLGNFESADARLTWSAVDGCRARLTLEGKVRDLSTLEFIYPLLLNAQEHLVGGVPTPSPSLAWSMVMVDGLGQQSDPVSGTLVNAPPSAPTAVLLGRGSTGFNISIAAPEAKDFRDYTIRIIKDGTTLESFSRTIAGFFYMAQASARYKVGVVVNDVFGQASGELVSTQEITLDVLTSEEIRADCIYSDNLGTAAATLAALKDEATTSVVTYPTGAAWNYTQATRATAWRVGNISLSTSGGGQGYVAISETGDTWSYFAGPLASDGVTLTACATETAARAAALPLPTSGTWALPSMASARYIRLGHRSSGTDYTLGEFYPPTLIVADNIRVGTLRGFTLIGDQLVVNELAALTSNLGAVNISGICTIGPAGGIWQGSEGTFANPITGYKMYQATNGRGLWETWLSGVKQVYLGEDMALYTAQGRLKFDSTGMVFLADQVRSGTKDAITWRFGAQQHRIGYMRAWAADFSSSPNPPSDPLYYNRSINIAVAGPPDPRSLANQYEVSLNASTTANWDTNLDGGTQFAGFYAYVNPALNGRSSTVGAHISAQYTNTSGSMISNTLFIDPTRTFTRNPIETQGYIEAGQGGSTAYNPIRMGQNPLYTENTTAGLWLKGGDYLFYSDGSSLTVGAPSAAGSARVRRGTASVFLSDSSNTYINAPSGTVQLRTGGTARAWADTNGNFTITNAFYPGNQTNYYMFYASGFAGLQTNWDFKVGASLQVASDIWLGARGTWLSGVIDQAVKTTDSPLFQNVRIGDSDTGLYTNGDGRVLGLANGVSMIGWVVGTYPGFYVDYAGKSDTTSINWGLRFGGDGSGEGISGPRTGGNQYGIAFWTGYTARMQIGSNGNVSIGPSLLPTGNTRLFLRGADASSANYAIFVQNSDTSNLWYLRNDGYSWVNQAWTVGSDLRYKKEIRYLGEEDADRILDLSPVEYTHRMSSRRMLGWIAQDVQTVEETLVIAGEDGYLGLQESGILPLAVIKVQQHERRIDQLEQENADMRQQIAALLSSLGSLGARLDALEHPAC